MSIVPDIDLAVDRTFDHLYDLVGRNTGNLLFTNAVWSQIEGEKQRVNFSFDPKQLNSQVDALIIPAANWAGPHVNLAGLADRVEALDIPVVMIGLGAQADAGASAIDLPDGTLRLLKAIEARSSSISLRGRFTQAALAKYGIDRTVVTGCPSLYHTFYEVPPAQPGKGYLLHATRYSMAGVAAASVPVLQRAIFRTALKDGHDLLFQSEPEELEALTHADQRSSATALQWSALSKLYGAASEDALRRFIALHGKTFFSVGAWAEAVQSYAGVFGTRLHGTIMALNSGVPAVLQTHDSRTQEMAEFASIPSVGPDFDVSRRGALRQLFAKYQDGAYQLARKKNKLAYESFLAENGLSALTEAT